VPHVRPSRCIAQVEVGIKEPQKPQVLRQGGRQHEPGIGHQMLVREGHLNRVETVARSHRESAFL
jgi:hypothetical protein